jgi:adenine-specific DNA-methyltransferase
MQIMDKYLKNGQEEMTNLLPEKVNSVLKNEERLLAKIGFDEKGKKYKPAQLFSEIETHNYIGIESRRYIGNKAKLTKWIFNIINSEIQNCETFLDMFAGTASVAKNSFQYFKKIIINDILESNFIIYRAFFEKSLFDLNKVKSIIKYYNSLNSDDLPENYFSAHFGNKFFDYKNSKVIGYIREDLEQRKSELSEKEFCILLATLIYGIDKIANTVGHFDAYIKKPIRFQKLELKLVEQYNYDNIEIYNQDANILARKVKSDIVYVDPPYNSRQYNRFYHIYENLTQWKKPELFGVALKPISEKNSLYCTTKAKETFSDLIENLDTKYIVVSYNNTYNAKSNSSENKIKLQEITEILNKRGDTKTFESHHKFFNTGKTEFNDHKELLFICRVR